MPININVKADLKATMKFISQLHREVTDKNGVFQKEIRVTSKKIVRNAANRYSNIFKYKGHGPDVEMAIIESGFQIISSSGQDLSILFFPENVLDNLTALPPTVVKGQVYSLWRLLHFGWGRRGRKRADDYPLFVIIQTSSIKGLSPGRYPPFPEILNLETDNSNVMVIRHPGFKGKEWFLNHGNLFLEDEKTMKENLNKALQKAINKAEK